MVAPQLSREVLVLVILVACQLLYSQVYPVLRPVLPETWFRAEATLEPGSTAQEALSAASRTDDQEAGSLSGAAEPDPDTDKAEPAALDAMGETITTALEAWPEKLIQPKRRGRHGKNPKFKIGQVVRDKVMMLRGIVTGWDAPCRGPAWWRTKRLVVDSWAQDPCYGLLVDLRDAGDTSADEEQLKVNLTQYAPEAILESLSREAAAASPLVNPLINLNFRFFDEGRYIPELGLIRSYPDDVLPHYADLDTVETNEKGQPLLRIVEFGRFIAHGAPLPVIRKGMFLVATEGVRGDIFSKSAILVLEHVDAKGTLGVITNRKMQSVKKTAKLGHAVLEKAEAMLVKMQAQTVPESEIKSAADAISTGRRILKYMQLPAVDVRVGGPVGLQEFPLALEHHIVLHPFVEPKALRKASKLALSGSGAQDSPDLFYARLGDLKKEELDMLISLTMEAGKAAGRSPPVLLFVGNSAWGPLQLAGEIRGGLGGGSSWGWVPASTREVLSPDQQETWQNLSDSPAIQFLAE